MVSENDVLLAQRGDKRAFVRLMDSCEQSLYRVSKGILKEDSDCADAIQETILKSYKSITKLKKPTYFKTWITRILINECYDLLRKRNKVIPMESLEEQLPDTGYNDSYFLELSDSLSKVDYKHRVVLTLFYFEDFSIKEISTILKIREGTVKSRLNRARTKLSSLLEMEERRLENGE